MNKTYIIEMIDAEYAKWADHSSHVAPKWSAFCDAERGGVHAEWGDGDELRVTTECADKLERALESDKHVVSYREVA